MERPTEIPQCHAKNKVEGTRWAFEPCPVLADGELVYDKPKVKEDISWPYCKSHLLEFEPQSKNLWIDWYDPPVSGGPSVETEALDTETRKQGQSKENTGQSE